MWARKNAEMEPDELSRIGPGFVCEAEADLQRRDAFRCLNPAVPSGATLETPIKFDLNPPVILTKGNGPF